MTATDPAATAARALSLLDLTDLSDTCDAAAVRRLCARAHTPFGHAAAVCIWPRFVAEARRVLGDAGTVRIATVVNFPSGAAESSAVAAETRAAIADGADEIDLVIPYRALVAGDQGAVSTMVRAARNACTGTVLKAILETGELREPRLIEVASELAVAAGADFLKTSTGKVATNATIEAARTMLDVIRRSARPVGFKAAGGISTVSAAADYLLLAENVMGPGWATPRSFRFGASSLLDAILATLRDEATASPADAY